MKALRSYTDIKQEVKVDDISAPPQQSKILLLLIFLLCVATIPYALSSIDQDATIDTLTNPLFPEYISRSALGWIRIIFSAFIFSVTAYQFFEEREPFITHYLESSKLKQGIKINVDGIKYQYMFTSVSWNMLGLSFALNGLITLFVEKYEAEMNIEELPYIKNILRGAFFLFETVAPLTLLVSVVVTYALWPNALKAKKPNTAEFKRPAVLLQHNANTFMTLMEVGLLGGVPIRFSDMALAPLFGISYILFSWFFRFSWTPCRSPQFVYFFLDTTTGKTSTIALLVLVFVLLFFYNTLVLIDDLLLALGGGILTHGMVIFMISYLCFKFKD